MATAALFHDPLWVPLDSSGNAYPGAKMYIYRAGTSTAVVTYTTYDTLGSNHTSPVTASSAGVFPAIWVAKTDAYRYRRVIKTSAGVTIRDDDNLSFPAAIPSAYDRTAAETAAGVTPTNYAYPPGDVRRYGTVGDGVTDDTTAFLAAIAAAEAGGPRTISIPGGTFLVSATIQPSAELFGLRIVGAGSQVTTIKASHSVGAVLHINRTGGGLSGLNITATSARTAGAAGSNYGLLIEAADTSGKAVAHYDLTDVIVQNQPNHGIVVSGPSTNATWNRVIATANAGHGVVMDSGWTTGRSNKGPVGQYAIDDLWSYGNGGHAICIGSPNDTTAAGICYRINIRNLETVNNASNATFRINTDEVWMHGENIVLSTPAFGAYGTHGGFWFAGRGLEINNPRFVSCTVSGTFGADPVAGQVTERVLITNFRAINAAQDPAFVVEDLDNVSNVTLEMATAGNITSWFTAGAVKCVVNLSEPVSVVTKTSDETVNNSATVQNDDALFMPLRISEAVTFEALIRYVGASATSDFKCTFVAPSGATVRWGPAGGSYVNTSDAFAVVSGEAIEGSELAFGTAAANGARWLHLVGRCLMSTTAGNLQFKWAQNSATAEDTSVLSGSQLIVHRANIR